MYRRWDKYIVKVVFPRNSVARPLESIVRLPLFSCRTRYVGDSPGDVVRSRNGRLIRRQHTHDFSSGLWHSHRFSGTCLDSVCGSPLRCWMMPSRPVHSRSAGGKKSQIRFRGRKMSLRIRPQKPSQDYHRRRRRGRDTRKRRFFSFHPLCPSLHSPLPLSCSSAPPVVESPVGCLRQTARVAHP